MQKKIVIASILKPVSDTRMFEKFGHSLSNTNKYEVNIIGFYSKNIINAEKIKVFPIYNFDRLSLLRLLAPLKYLQILLKVKPELIIVTTPELLPVTYLYHKLFSCKIIYDIIENYKFNILFNKVYPSYIKSSLALLVRKIEVYFSRHISYFFLAESCYQEELNFIGKNYVVLENKYKELNSIPAAPKMNEKIHLLYSGTIAKNYGIMEAIHFAKKLHSQNDHIYLTIAGFCAQKDLLKKIKSEIADCDFIQLIGGDKLVPHEQIISLIKIADFGLVPYQPDKSLENKIPTKLYEYLANKLPVIIQNHEPWVSFCKPFTTAIKIDYTSFDAFEVLRSLDSANYYGNFNKFDLLWDSEEKKLLAVVEDCLK